MKQNIEAMIESINSDTIRLDLSDKVDVAYVADGDDLNMVSTIESYLREYKNNKNKNYSEEEQREIDGMNSIIEAISGINIKREKHMDEVFGEDIWDHYASYSDDDDDYVRGRLYEEWKKIDCPEYQEYQEWREQELEKLEKKIEENDGVDHEAEDEFERDDAEKESEAFEKFYNRLDSESISGIDGIGFILWAHTQPCDLNEFKKLSPIEQARQIFEIYIKIMAKYDNIIKWLAYANDDDSCQELDEFLKKMYADKESIDLEWKSSIDNDPTTLTFYYYASMVHCKL